MAFKSCVNYDGKGNMCPRRPQCTELCEEAEEYVSQGYVGGGRIGGEISRQPGWEDSFKNEWVDIMNYRYGFKSNPHRFDQGDMDKISDACLTPEQHVAVQGCLVEGKSITQVAEEEGVTRQSIQSRLKNAAISVERYMKRLKTWDRVKDRLHELTNTQQRLVFLRFHEGLRTGRIADLMDLELSNVGHQIENVRRKLGLPYWYENRT